MKNKLLINSNIKSLFLVFLTLLYIGGCKTIKLVPDFDASISEQIMDTAKKVDAHYITMIGMFNNSITALPYEEVHEGYEEIEIELNSILLKNKVRELNNESIQVSSTVLETFIKYKERHKSKATGQSKIMLEDDWVVMKDLMFLLSVSEDAKRYASEKEKQENNAGDEE